MLTKTKIALAAALVAVTSSVALAQSAFDPNLGNRYPAYGYAANRNGPVSLHRASRGALHSAPVQLQYRRLPADTNDGQWFDSVGGGP